jgi:hypothetical protein
MNPTGQPHLTRRLACVLAALAVIGLAGAAPAAFARTVPPPHTPAVLTPTHPAPVPVHWPPLPPGWNKHPPLPGPVHVHPAPARGMPRWQITLIVAGAAVLAAVAMLTDPAQATRRHRGAPGT